MNTCYNPGDGRAVYIAFYYAFSTSQFRKFSLWPGHLLLGFVTYNLKFPFITFSQITNVKERLQFFPFPIVDLQHF